MQEKVKEEKLFPIHFPYSLPNPGPYGAGRGSEKKLFTIHSSLFTSKNPEREISEE